MSEFNAENRNARIFPTRSCSFCKNAGHNILACSDVRLLDFERLCVANSASLGSAEFKNWLFDCSLEEPSIVRAYAVRYCNCNVRSYMHIYVCNIIERINRLETLRQQQDSADVENVAAGTLQNSMSLSYIANFIERAVVARIRQNKEDIDNTKFDIQINVVECVNANEIECGICYDNTIQNEVVKLNCGHKFCKDCIKQSLKNVRTKNPQCAFCRTEIKNIELTNHYIRDEFNDLIIATI